MYKSTVSQITKESNRNFTKVRRELEILKGQATALYLAMYRMENEPEETLVGTAMSLAMALEGCTDRISDICNAIDCM